MLRLSSSRIVRSTVENLGLFGGCEGERAIAYLGVAGADVDDIAPPFSSMVMGVCKRGAALDGTLGAEFCDNAEGMVFDRGFDVLPGVCLSFRIGG